MTDTDISTTIAPKSDQMNADDLIAGPLTLRVTGVRLLADEQPVAIHFEGQRNPYKPCKSMRRVLVQLWGADGKNYAGRSMTLYRDPEVSFGGSQVGGIRISHMSHIDGDKKLSLTASRGHRKPYTVKPLTSEPTRSPAAISEPDFDLSEFAREVEAKCAAATDPVALKEWANSEAITAKRVEVKRVNPDLATSIRTTIADRIGMLTTDEV